MKNILVTNIILFQVGWFACVITAAMNLPWIGMLIALCIIASHLKRARWPIQEISLLAIAMAIGLVWDSLLVWQDWIVYTSGMLNDSFAPYWIIILWALFASTLNISLKWFKDKLLLAAFAGAIAGPLAYYGGQNLGALTFSNTSTALLALSLGWAVFTPLLVYLSNFYDGYQIKTQESVSWTG